MSSPETMSVMASLYLLCSGVSDRKSQESGKIFRVGEILPELGQAIPIPENKAGVRYASLSSVKAVLGTGVTFVDRGSRQGGSAIQTCRS